MKHKIMIAFFVIIVQFSFGQQFTDLYGDYLGQTPPGDTPVVFAPGIVSKENSKEHCLAVSPKGDEMFFTTGTWPNSVIMHVKENGDKWGQPEPASFLKNDWATQPAFSPEGRYLYFSSSRKETDIRFYSIWRCKKTADGWSEPENVINMEGDLIMLFHPSVDNNGSVYFLRFDYPNQTGDLYVAEASDETLVDPVKLNSPISTEFSEVRPTVDPQGRYLLYVSDRPGGCGGKDVYVCYRNPDGAWSAPENLGSELNTPGNDDVSTISPDGKYWFFEKDGDIYWRSSPLNSDDATVKDIDGNVYKTVTIGTQVWMAENLKTTKYRNGDLIGITTPDTMDISKEQTPKYQWAYDGNENNVAVYGRLYTWYAVNDSRNICPCGWHVPSKNEFEKLISNIGGRGYTGYQSLLPGGSSGFSALFSGIRVEDGHFEQMSRNQNAVFWSLTKSDDGYAWFMSNYSDRQDAHLYAGPYGPLSMGCSVRCIKD